MKLRLIWAAIAALFIWAGAAQAQTSVSGNLKDAGLVNVTSTNSFVRFELKNYGSNIPRTSATTFATPVKDFTPDASGNISGTVADNASVTPAGTFYHVCIWYNNALFRCGDFTITGANFNLNTATPITTVPVVSPPTGDTTYLRLNAGNGPPTQIGGVYYAGAYSAGTVTVPSVAPTVAVESTTGGTIPAGTYQCKVTYGNQNGETTASPAASVTTTGATSQIKIAAGDNNWTTGAYKLRGYCSNDSTNFFRQTPKTITNGTIDTPGNSGAVRASNIVTIKITGTTAHGLVPGQTSVTIAGVTDTSFNGTFTVLDVPEAANGVQETTFTYRQTGVGATSGNGTVTTSTGIDTTGGHLIGMSGNNDLILTSLTFSGVIPPTTNTATINPLQVAVNNAVAASGRVQLAPQTYTLTTPLILSGAFIEGHDLQMTDQAQRGATTITSSASFEAGTGTVMVMGPGVTLKNLSIFSVAGGGAAASPLTYFGAVGNMNDQYLEGVFLKSPSTTDETAGLRIHQIQEAHNWQFNGVSVNGAEFGVYVVRSTISKWFWTQGRINCGAPAGGNPSRAFYHYGGPGDFNRNANFFGQKTTIDVDIRDIDTESCNGPSFDVRNALLTLWRISNSDANVPAGTVASFAAARWESFSNGGADYGLRVYESQMFGSANANTTVRISTSNGNFGKNSFTSNLIQASGGSNVCWDISGTNRAVVLINNFNPYGTACTITTTTNSFLVSVGNVLGTTSDTYNGTSGRWRIAEAATFANRRTHLVSSGTYQLLAADDTSVDASDDTSGNWTFRGTTKAPSFISATANPAAAGIVRLSSGDVLSWRNAANTGDVSVGNLGAALGNRPADTLTITGPLSGWASNYYADTSTSTAAAGQIRLASASTINWRNNANSADISLSKNTSDQLDATGFAGLLVKQPTISLGISQGSGFKHQRGTAGCATAASAGATCTTTVTWTTAFADANYTAQCNGRLITSGVPLNGGLTAQVAASVTFQTVAATAAAAQFTNIDCVAIHD